MKVFAQLTSSAKRQDTLFSVHYLFENEPARQASRCLGNIPASSDIDVRLSDMVCLEAVITATIDILKKSSTESFKKILDKVKILRLRVSSVKMIL